MNSQIEETVRNCSKCATFQNKQTPEPLKPSPVPELPYQVVGCDLFDFQSKKYLILVDYFSHYVDVVELKSPSTTSTLEAMKSVFACHGIPRQLRSDNGPQFTSQQFKSFCRVYDIEHKTSSPNFQSSNGEAERAVQTVKRLWRKADDKYVALLDYRTTPLEGINLSPAQLLMNRRPRNTMPASTEVLKPTAYHDNTVKARMKLNKANQKKHFDQRYIAKELEPLKPTDSVRIMPNSGERQW
ncbi:uncharacterized protein K02A2.6-like [Ostrea edulis]|uniref:uncharacterized protein K02A2.6-like n=1 Tax=Ostrea edulis TaxID=37623 RepID=UPI0020945CB1|nr:uncharacterized protein K02A2.6-like [Ostrea edulis]